MRYLKWQNLGGFTTVSNTIFENDDLDLADIGMICFLLHLPDGWQFSIEGLARVLKNNGKTSIRGRLNRLEEAGYLVRVQTRENNGFGTMAWVVSDYPLTAEDIDKISERLRGDMVYDFPSSENLMTEKETTRNHTQTIKKENNKNAISDFDLFWNAYPKKVGKGDARKAFAKAIKKTSLDELLQAVETQKKSGQWNKNGGQYIPNPSTWLNQERWDDELEENAGQSNPFMQGLREIYLEETEREYRYEQERGIAGSGDPENGLPVGLPGLEPG